MLSSPVPSTSHAFRDRKGRHGAHSMGDLHMALFSLTDQEEHPILERGESGPRLDQHQDQACSETFPFFRDSEDRLLRTVFHQLGGGFLVQWLISSTNHAGRVRPLSFYREITVAIALLRDLFSWVYLLGVKRRAAYWSMVDTTPSCHFECAGAPPSTMT